MPWFRVIIELVILVFSGFSVVIQIREGVIGTGNNYRVERRKAPIHFWAIIGVQLLAALVVVLGLHFR